MRIIRISSGISWVEIPAAGLKVLCGCPADSVKHLMKRGLIVPTQVEGVSCETGPDAILLSDVSLQNGHFNNLAEFPVLQMLYRQGLMLPGHPNNTGRRPLLIGLAEQINAQMDYIHRGNYGLVDEDEIMATGTDAATAAEWMRIKTRFAFGEIRPPEALLDTLTTDEGETIITSPTGAEVVLRRLGINIYEFSHTADDGTRDVGVVDMNLQSDAVFEPPYPLNYHDLKREYFAVVHSGEGDGWDINRPTMSSILMFQGKIYLIDAGPNLHTTLRALGIGVQEIEGIFHTHCHDDHFAGLNTLIRADHRIRYYATTAVRASVGYKLAALMGISDDVMSHYFEIHDLELDSWNDIHGLEVRPSYSPHPVETTVFQFRTLWAGGYRTYAHMADIVSFDVLEKMREDDVSKPGITSSMLETVQQNYLAPADLKKLDVGGGMIHGRAEDFRTDSSTKIILSHTSTELTSAQKAIGSGAPFGTVDVLIPTLQEYPLRNAHEYLRGFFPNVPDHELRLLLNHPVVTFNPETILLREGRRCDQVTLILSGMVEALTSAGIQLVGQTQLVAGALIGEAYGLTKEPARETYRATSFVHALLLPADLYASFVERNDLSVRVSELASIRAFFNRTWLLGENLSDAVENQLASCITTETLKMGDMLSGGKKDVVRLVYQGAIELRIDDTAFEQIDSGGFIGASPVLFGHAPPWQVHAREDTTFYILPGSMLREIPVVRWKMVETHQRRMRHLFSPSLEHMSASSDPEKSAVAFPWLDEYALGIEGVDEQHKDIFTLANRVALALLKNDHETAYNDMLALSDLARRHFHDEERLMERWKFPAISRHKKIHIRLLHDAHEISKRIGQGPNGPRPVSVEGFRRFFQSWIVDHIFREDRVYALHIGNREEAISYVDSG